MNVYQTGRSLLASALLLTASFSPMEAADKSNDAVNSAKSSAALGIEGAIHDYILTHPEVMLESIQLFQQRAELAKQQKTRDLVLKHQKDLEADPESPVLEAANQTSDPVTVVEFFDYRCGYCKKVDTQVTGLAEKPGIRIIYKDFPILGPESLLAAKAALAAGKQGKYNEFHHLLITATTPLNDEAVNQIARNLKLDVNRLRTDMANAEVSGELNRTMALAGTLGVQSTPSFVIGNNLLTGALTDQALASAIRTARDKNTMASAKPHAGGL